MSATNLVGETAGESESIASQTFPDEVILDIENVSISYSGNPAVKHVSFPIAKNRITSIIGPSGCGKSTLLRSINRMNDFIDGVTVDGNFTYAGHNVYSRGIDPVEV